MASGRYRDFHLLMRLLGQARPYWPHLVGLLVLSFVATPVALLMPLPLAMVVNVLSGTNPVAGSWLSQLGANSLTQMLILAAALLVGLSLLDQLQKLSTSLLGAHIGEKIVLRFRAEIFGHVQRLSLGYHDAKGTADSGYRIHWDAAAIQWLVIYGLPPSFTACLTLFGMIYVTARINGQLASVALAISPALFFITFAASRRLRSGWEITKNLESTVNTVVQEVLTSLRVVKAFGQEDREQSRFLTQSGESMRARIRIALVDGIFGLLFGLTLAIGTALVLISGALQVSRGNLALAELVLVMGYLAQLYQPVQIISNGIAMVQNALASAARVFEVLDEAVEVTEKRDARPLRRAAGAVAFRNVSFAYNGEPPVLNAVSVEVPPGTRVGIAGVSGAGKTTLMSLLFRFYDPTTGQILLDGTDLRDYKLADLRNQFSVVLQEPVLFSTTVAENIAYARPEATEVEIVEAAKAANAHEFIINLPNGYQTVVGERGVRFSGGERQRIALARALLKDAPILILDEPTSSVDMQTEAQILEAMQRLTRGRTAFLITHRPTTLTKCDLVVEIDGGRISDVTPMQPSGYV